MNPSGESVEMTDAPEVGRVLTVFSNPEEEFVTEHRLANFDLEKFRDWFNPDGGDPSMFYCYMVMPKDVEFLSAYLGEPVAFDFGRYCYFVEADATEEDWKRRGPRGE